MYAYLSLTNAVNNNNKKKHCHNYSTVIKIKTTLSQLHIQETHTIGAVVAQVAQLGQW